MERAQNGPPILFDWVFIPEGEFTMGSDPSHDRRTWGNERPQHLVYLSGYSIARVTVTNRQYHLFVTTTNHRTPTHWVDGVIPSGKEQHPVVEVDWYDAQAFCHWAGVRLPTEAEWEKAARGTDGRIYPWGDQKANKTFCNHNFSVGDTVPVGQYPKGASPYGVLDMAGNVWEWTGSKPGPYPYDTADGREAAGECEFRVLRGAAFRTVNLPRCAFRDVGTPPMQTAKFRGFRVASS